MRGGTYLLVLLFILVINCVSGLSVDVSEDVLLYPESEFYLIMTLTNEGIDNAVEIVGYSEGLDVYWNRSIFLMVDAGVKVGFVIDAIRDVGEYDILWSIKGEYGEVVNAKTRVLVSDLEGTLGNVIGYYGFELDELASYGESGYLEDARKNVEVAKDLASRGMDFEAQKYLDFARESMEAAVNEGTSKKVSSWDWIGSLRTAGVFVLVLGVLVLAGFVLFRFIDWLKDYGYALRGRRSQVAGRRVSKPEYVLDVESVRRRVLKIRDERVRMELLADLKNCEEKFRLGLPSLGRAYLERIIRKLGREVRRG